MNSIIPWVGGKRILRKQIVSMFPIHYKRYIEVFGGGAWVLFQKPPRRDFEVYNDLNSLLVNLFRCVRDKPDELMERLRYVLNSREEFAYAKAMLADPSNGSDVQRAAWFYQEIRQSYGAALTSFGGQPRSMRATFPLIEQASRRLERVVIEHQDCVQLIAHYDRKESLFYCDPPYHDTEKYYQNIGDDGFTETDHIRLRDALSSIQGKFLLSYNDDAFVRKLYDDSRFYIVETARSHSMAQRYKPQSQFPELIIANYDPFERARLQPVPVQMTLFNVN